MSFSIKQTWIECIGCGFQAELLQERKFKCPKCGNLFDIKHNLDLLEMYPAGWTQKFDARARRTDLGKTDNPLFHSGVWRFKEWIMPYLPTNDIVTLGEGNVPITKAGKNLLEWIGGDIDLHIIQEGMTPTGSFKDFGGTVMMSLAKTMGIKTVCCASTGDTSAMAAAYAAKAGIECVVILPKGLVTPAQIAQPLVHGALVIMLPGDFDDCMRVQLELTTNHGVFPANSINPSRIEGHQATVFLLAQHFGWELPDWIAAPVGNGSNVSSIGKGLRLIQEQLPNIGSSNILGCQSRAANPLARSWNLANNGRWDEGVDRRNFWLEKYVDIECGTTTATAARIGAPVSRDKVMREIALSRGAMTVAQEEDLNQAVFVCGRDGLFVCPQTGIALAGVKNAVKNGWIKAGDRVAVVSTANGLKFTESASENPDRRMIDSSDCSVESVLDLISAYS
ncbi:threonine synthase [Candidatus Parcubacteria bacterium]|nr:MAG: threonine synthase [Candidatus Parcubacteria bacterium]